MHGVVKRDDSLLIVYMHVCIASAAHVWTDVTIDHNLGRYPPCWRSMGRENASDRRVRRQQKADKKKREAKKERDKTAGKVSVDGPVVPVSICAESRLTEFNGMDLNTIRAGCYSTREEHRGNSSRGGRRSSRWPDNRDSLRTTFSTVPCYPHASSLQGRAHPVWRRVYKWRQDSGLQ